ncbi:MAG TPA: DUF1178 family protein [Rhizomicrobium sp.]|nr:DUF1178 family protein [Rhizomicrobium sp.]
MIVYSLRCKDSHEFEGWFKDSHAFDAQASAGKLVCPLCGSRKVEKGVMAPAIAGAKSADLNAPEELRKMRQFMSGLRKFVQDHGEYVGPRFAEEARKIHYGESEERQIYGEATVKEAVELIEEGVEVAPLPPDVDETAN